MVDQRLSASRVRVKFNSHGVVKRDADYGLYGEVTNLLDVR